MTPRLVGRAALGVGLLVGPFRALAAQAPSLAIDSSYSCVVCHAEHRRAFLSGVHAERGIQCHNCHGGNPAAQELPGAHAGHFLGRPSKLQIATLCASCHADPNKMRQFGLPYDQLAGLRASRHGQLLERGDPDAPTCTDCHESHLIRRATDARSNSYPANIPVLCARCHADAKLMGKYGLPTDQFTQYVSSAHGVAVFQDENFAAPTCVGCHGSHSALPPGVTQIADVCGRCHTLVRQAFFDGPHGAPAKQGRLAGCVGCHSNHGTERVPQDSIAETCLKCHPAGSAPAALGVELEARIARAANDLLEAQRAIDVLIHKGRDVTDSRLRYEDARTWYRQVVLVQHDLDLATLEDLELRVASATRTIDEAAAAAGENEWEHKLLLVPVWFLALALVALAWIRIADRRRDHGARG